MWKEEAAAREALYRAVCTHALAVSVCGVLYCCGTTKIPQIKEIGGIRMVKGSHKRKTPTANKAARKGGISKMDVYVKPAHGDKVDISAHILWNEVEKLALDGKKWPKQKLLLFARKLHKCRSIQYDGIGDCGQLRELLSSFRTFITNNPKFSQITDPFYCFLDLSQFPRGAVPINAWNLPLSLQGSNSITAINNFENVYKLPNERGLNILTGVLVSQFPGLRVLPVISPTSVEVEWR